MVSIPVVFGVPDMNIITPNAFLSTYFLLKFCPISKSLSFYPNAISILLISPIHDFLDLLRFFPPPILWSHCKHYFAFRFHLILFKCPNHWSVFYFYKMCMQWKNIVITDGPIGQIDVNPASR